MARAVPTSPDCSSHTPAAAGGTLARAIAACADTTDSQHSGGATNETTWKQPQPASKSPGAVVPGRARRGEPSRKQRPQPAPRAPVDSGPVHDMQHDMQHPPDNWAACIIVNHAFHAVVLAYCALSVYVASRGHDLVIAVALQMASGVLGDSMLILVALARPLYLLRRPPVVIPAIAIVAVITSGTSMLATSPHVFNGLMWRILQWTNFVTAATLVYTASDGWCGSERKAVQPPPREALPVARV